MRIRIVQPLALLLALVGGPISATPADDIEMIKANAPQISAIIKSVAQSNTPVDKRLHDRFWSLLPDSVAHNPAPFLQSLDLISAVTYQKELWESIRLSARAGKVVKTLSYDSAKDRAYLGNSRSTELAALADKMLEAAASGKPYHGETINGYLTEQMANQVLDGLNATSSGLQILLNPNWREP